MAAGLYSNAGKLQFIQIVPFDIDSVKSPGDHKVGAVRHQ